MSHPLAGASVGFVKVPVSNFDAARAFYGETLGLKEDYAFPEYGWAQFATGSVPICLFKPGMGGGSRAPGGETGIQLRVLDARAAYEHLGDAASHFGEGDDGSISFTARDPDGNEIQISQVMTGGVRR